MVHPCTIPDGALTGLDFRWPTRFRFNLLPQSTLTNTLWRHRQTEATLGIVVVVEGDGRIRTQMVVHTLQVSHAWGHSWLFAYRLLLPPHLLVYYTVMSSKGSTV